MVDGALVIPPGVLNQAQGKVQVTIRSSAEKSGDDAPSILQWHLEHPAGKSDFVPLTREEANDRYA
ncbi:MAG: hypothetical protein QM811_23475 [Pirellulales bacterium]